MKKLTKEEEMKQIVDYNMELCHTILLRCKMINKGRYVHDINATY